MSKITGALAPHRTLVGLFCTALLAALACGSGDSAPEAASPGSGSPSSAAEAPAGAGAKTSPEAALSRGQLPADYPSDLPVYPGAEAGSALGIPGAAMMVTFSTGDSVEDVSGFLEGALPKQGWAVTDQSEGTFEATKDSRKARFRISAVDSGGSTIAVSVTGG